VKSATASDVLLKLSWAPQGPGALVRIPVHFSGAIPPPGEHLPKHISAGKILLRVIRPPAETTVAVNTNGDADGVVLTPLPPEGPERLSYSGTQTVATKYTGPFNFIHRDSGSGKHVRFNPWTYIAPKDGQIEVNATFTFSKTSYAVCLIYLNPPSHQVADSARTDNTRDWTNPATQCAVQAAIDVKKGDRVQVSFGHALYIPTGQIDVTGRVTVEYL
jgi:hypothetical protein